jgi:hypothetical protein
METLRMIPLLLDERYSIAGAIVWEKVVMR